MHSLQTFVWQSYVCSKKALLQNGMFTNNNYIFKSTWKLRRINYCTIFAWRHMLVLTCYDKYSSFVFTKGLTSNGVSLSNTLLLYSLNPCKAARSWHFDHEWTQRFYWPSSQVLCSLLSRWARFSRPKLQYLIRVCGMQIRQVPLMPLLLSAQSALSSNDVCYNLTLVPGRWKNRRKLCVVCVEM